MKEKTRKYLSGRFKDYYRTNKIELPPNYKKREWGYIPWSDTPMVRHISYFEMGGQGLKTYFSQEAPHSIFFSCSRYEHPGRKNMDDKNWIGADLVFDIDAPEIPNTDEDDSMEVKLNKAKKEAIKLIDFIKNDLEYEEYKITFSGGKGFHVHVRDDEVQELGSSQRDEITEYLNPKEISLEDLLKKEPSRNYLRVPHPCYGWSKRFYEKYLDRIKKLRKFEEEELEKYLKSFENKYSLEESKRELEKKTTIIGEINRDSFLYEESWRILSKMVKNKAVWIDQPVTRDVKRLIRLPNSLHGKSGLKTTVIPEEELSDFKPLTDSVPEKFRKTEKKLELEIMKDSMVNIDGIEQEVKEGENRRFPEHIAIHLMCRGIAELK